MYEAFLTLISTIGDLAWGPWTMIFIAFVSVYLTVRTRFFQVTSFLLILRSTFGRKFDRSGDQNKERMTPFQATTTSLAGTLGMGNMAGVATALSIGGPGVLANGATGIEMLLDAFSTYYLAEFANAFISVAILTFCLSTQIAFFVYFETALVSLLGEKKYATHATDENRQYVRIAGTP